MIRQFTGANRLGEIPVEPVRHKHSGLVHTALTVSGFRNLIVVNVNISLNRLLLYLYRLNFAIGHLAFSTAFSSQLTSYLKTGRCTPAMLGLIEYSINPPHQVCRR